MTVALPSYLLLKDNAPSEVGAYVDPMHMCLEGGLSGWEMTLDALAPWVALVGVKNYVSQAVDRDEFGQQRFRVNYVPLADGMAPLPQFFRRLKEIGYLRGPGSNGAIGPNHDRFHQRQWLLLG